MPDNHSIRQLFERRLIRVLGLNKLGRAWIRANMLSALVYAPMTLLAVAIIEIWDVTGPSKPGRWIFIGILSFSAAVALGSYGILTGNVLAQKLPDFPKPQWNNWHFTLGAGYYFFIGVISAYLDASSANTMTLIAIVLIGGPICGAAFGALQAIVLSDVALGVGAWIGWSALSGTIWGTVMMTTLVMPDYGWFIDSLIQLARPIAVVAAAFVMLPAVARLTPRPDRGLSWWRND